MVPDAEQRLAKAVADLEDLVVRPSPFRRHSQRLVLMLRTCAQASTEDELSASDEFKRAKEALQLAEST